MNKIKKLRFDKLLPFYLVIYSLCIVSLIDLGKYSYLSILDLIVTLIFLTMVASLLVKNKISATQYQATVIFMVIGLSIICFATSVKHAISVTEIHWSFFGIMALIFLAGLLMQLPYYADVLISALPELKKSGKIQIHPSLWNIHVKTTYNSGKIESKINALMKQLSFLTYFAPGIGMLVSRNLGSSGESFIPAFLFMFLSLLLMFGAALPIGEYSLINEINKTEDIILKI